MNAAIQANVLTAHEIKSGFRYSRLLGEITNIKRTLDLLRSSSATDVTAALHFEEKYRAQVGARHGSIQPPHLETAKKFPIDDLYVTPTFLTAAPSKPHREPQRLSLEQFLAVAHRTVLLGNPGGGKSTFALKLCHDLAARYSDRLMNARLLTPVLVTLREYGSYKKTNPCSILHFIESQASSRYQVTSPAGSFEYLLLNGHMAVIFDGLDELLDTSYRQEISSDVESFCNVYPAVPVLVSPREVGYDQAPLDPRQFKLLKIAPFDDDQVRDYAMKWFAIDDEFTAEQCEHKAEAFLAESSLAADLRNNPLMLGLMCNLYRAEGYIPRNRPEIYEKCSLMLFERWDKSRGILVPLPFEEHIKPAMRHLAHWIYSQESLQGGVTQSRLIDETASYLAERVFEDIEKARRAAADFIQFCTGRAWVFTDTGTTSEGEKLYQFTHRTFLEYFAAAYLFSVHPTPVEMLSVLLPRIAKQEWDVVAQLAFQIESRSVEGAADKLLTGLLESAIQLDRQERWSVVLFALRMLESIVPSPSVRRAVACAAVRECIASGAAIRSRHTADGAFGVMIALYEVGVENRSTVGDAVEQALVETINSGSAPERDRAAGYDIAFQLRQSIFHRGKTLSTDAAAYWSSVSSRTLRRSSASLEVIAARDLYTAQLGHDTGDIAVKKLLEWHGPKAVFDPPHSKLFAVWWPSLAIRFLMGTVGRREWGPEWEISSEALGDIGRFLAGIAPPWIRRADPQFGPDMGVFSNDLIHRLAKREPSEGFPSLQIDAMFAVWALLAVLAEHLDDGHRAELLHGLGRLAGSNLDQVLVALLARFDRSKAAMWRNEIFPPPYGSIVESWVKAEVALIATTYGTDSPSGAELHEAMLGLEESDIDPQ